MKFFTTKTNYTKTAFAFLAVLFCSIIGLKSWGQTTTVPFTTAGATTWFCPAGVTSITVECWGGGGAGGGANANPSAGGGGAGGAYTKAINIPVTPGTTYNLFVGAGGIGTTTTAGPSGGSSWFNTSTTLLAVGGNGGGNAANGAAGTGPVTGNIGGTTNFYGGNGVAGIAGNRGGGGGSSAGTTSNGNTAINATGGVAVTGGGAGANGATTNADGFDATTIGGGGGGGRTGNATDRSGGNGFTGKVAITYTTPLTYRSQLVSMNLGSTNWCAGETRTVSIIIKNIGTATWVDASRQDINVGIKWNMNGANWTDYYIRTDVGNVVPGAQATYTFSITASNNIGAGYTTPLAAGSNNLIFDIVYEAVSWFGDNGGGTGPGNTKFTSPAQTIVAIPGAPTGTANQSFCAINNPTVANLAATVTLGNTLIWYATATGGTALVTTTPLTSGHYYASQTTSSGCESTTRFDVTATVGNPAAPTSAGVQSFCAINNPTVANLNAVGTSLKWYTAPSGGTALVTTTALATGTYYASQTVSGCESATRLSVPVTVGNPAAPTSAGVQSFCAINNPTVADLNAIGTSLKWYTAPSGGAALATTTALATGTYYASQTVSGCESATRLSVPVTVNNPAAPTGTATQIFCSSSNPTIANLTATGTGIQWYSATTGGTALATSTPLVNGTHYYASQTVGSCESATRFDVTAVVNDAVVITSDPGPATQIACATSTVTYSVSATGTGLTYQWLFNGNPMSDAGRISGTTTNTLHITGVTLADDGDYSVIVTGTSPCAPATSAIAHLDVDQRITFIAQPATPQTLCPNDTYTIYAQVTGTVAIYQWYYNGNPSVTGAFDGVDKYTLTIPNVTAANAGSYRLFLDDGTGVGCTSANSNIAVLNINTNTSTTDPLATQTVCQNAATTALSVTASGTGPFTYQWYSNTTNNNTTGTSISGASSFTYTPPATIAGTTYYYVIVTGNCNSATSAVAQVIVNPLAFINAKTPAAICSGGSFSVTPVDGTAGDIVPSGTTYSWSAPAAAGITGAAGGTNQTSINGTLTNTTSSAKSITYIVTPTSGSCTGASFNITVTVNPKPSIATKTPAAICSGSSFSVTPVDGAGGDIVPSGIAYSWSAPAATGITGAAAGTNQTSISGTLTNTTSSAKSITYIVTPTSGSCTGTSFNVTVTVSPKPSISDKTPAAICSGGSFSVIPVDGSGGDLVPSGTTYSWSAPTAAGITGAASGTNQTSISGTLTNTTSSAKSITYIVTPTSGSCTGTSFNVTVTVNPKATIATKTPAAICSGGSFSVTPVDGTGGDIVPSGTTYSWSAPTATGITGAAAGTNQTSISGTLTNTTNSAKSITYTVIPTSGSCTGISFSVTVTVSPKPSIADKTTPACSGAGFTVSPTNGTDIVPTGTTYSWSVPVVTGGLTGGATGTNATNITGTLTNPTNSAQTATYTVTPTSGSCTGSTFTVIVTVNPKAAISAKTSTTCSGTGFSVTPVDGTSGDVIPTGTTYSWPAPTATGITGGALGSGATSITGTLTNTTSSAKTITYTITPTSGTCAGPTFTVTVTVNPKPSVAAKTASTCSGTGFSVTPTDGTDIVPAGTTYSWNAPAMSAGISGGVSGSGSNITGTLINSNNTSGTATYTVTPTSGTCVGSTFTVTVTVTSTPFVTGQTITTCSGTGFSITPSNGGGNIIPTGGTGTRYAWSAPVVTGGMTGGVAATNQTSITGTLNNNSGTVQTATYTVTPSTSSCTGPTFTVTVTVNPLPTITTTGVVTPKCFSASAQTSTLAYSTTTQSPTTYSIDWASGITDVTNATLPATPITIPIPAGRAPGTYTGTLTVKNANGCTSSGTPVSITVYALPTPTLTTDLVSPICANTNITYTTQSGQSNYVWTFGGSAGTDYTLVSGGNSTSNTAVVSWITPGTKTVTVNYANGNGCVAVTPTSNSITVLAVPTGTVTVTENSGTTNNDNIVCTGDAVTFTAPAGNSYIWYLNGAIVQGPSTDNTYSTTTLITTNVVTVDVANGNNCGTTFTAPSVTVNPLPAPVLTVTESSGTANDKIICPNSPVTLTVTPVNAGSTYSFIVNGATVSTGTSNSYTANNISSNATVAVMETNSNGCQTTTATQSITVNPVPSGTLSASPGNTFCAGTNVTFTATSGFSNYNFKINGTTVGTPGPTNTFSSTTLANGDVVTVDVTNTNGCTTTFNSIAVTVNPLPAGTLTATENSGTPDDYSICANASIKFIFSTAGYSNYNFKINGVSKQSNSSNSFITTALVAGDIVTVDVTNSGCSVTFTAPAVTIIPSPTGTLSVSPSNIICAGDNVIFTATIGFDNYNFQINGSTVQNGAGNTFSTTTLADNDIVSVDVTNSNGCTSTFNAITMVVNPLPTGTLQIAENAGTANDGIICTGTMVTFTAPTGFANYNFLLNGAPAPGQNGTNIYTTSALIDNDKVTVAVTGTGGCVALLNSFTITVNPLPTVAPITTTAPSFAVCIGSGIALADATNTGGTFTWSSENTARATVDPVTGVVTGVTAGTVIIDYIFTNGNGCSSTVTATVTVHALPDVEPITGNFNICIGPGNSSQLSDATNTGGSWIWSSDDESIATVDASTGMVTGVAPGTDSIRYAFTDANGCTKTVSVEIVVTSTPTVAPITTTAPSGFNVCVGGTITLKDATPSGVWSSSDALTADVNSTGIVSGVAAGTADISYTITTSCGQMISDVKTVTVNPQPSATISYTGGPFCTTAGPVAVNQTGTTGGTYSYTGPGVLSLAPNGTIDPSASAPGTYTVTYTIAASGGCGVYTTTASVIITAAPSATIAYSGSPYCSTVATASVTRTGTPGGTYSSTAGLIIDGVTGAIIPGSSTAGTYPVTYTIAASGGCAQFTTTTAVTITTAPSATISYTGNPFCKTSAPVNPTLTGTTGGTYSSTAGLTINTAGIITPSSSTAGTYTVTYTVTASGGCSLYTTTTSVTVTDAPTAVAGTPVSTCSNSGAVNITAGSSATNTSGIVWTSNGTGTFANPTSLTTATYTPSPADIAAGSRILTLTANGNGNCGAAISTKTITISAPPAAFIITPSSANICAGDVQPLLASTNTPPVTTTVTFSSANNLTLAIPNNSSAGASNTVAVSGIPAGAVINNVSVKFYVSHGYDADLYLNLKAPNGNVLNLVNRRGGNGNNFGTNANNTTISSATATPINGSAPFTGTYAADAANNVGATGNVSNVGAFSSLYGTPNGNWTFSGEDVVDCEASIFGFCIDGPYSGTINNWSIAITYTTSASPLAVMWNPVTNLYTDPGATTAYTGTNTSTVYVESNAAANTTYTATQTNAANCSTSQTVNVIVNPKPVVTISADYCISPGKVRLTANSVPAATSWVWSTGATTQSIDVNTAGSYTVTAFGAGTCPGNASINVATELVTNGDFEAGNGGFTSDFAYHADVPGLVPAGQGELFDDNGNNGYSITTSGQNVHNNFWGHDHGTGTGNFMAINGHDGIIAWKETVSVLPNTTYYFSAWAMSLNNATPFAQLRFSVNGTLVGTTAVLAGHGETAGSPDNWTQFYGSWTSGPTTTSVDIYINDLQGNHGGNDFGLDDISFGTLSTFISLASAPGTDAQNICVNTPLTDIVYNVGNGNPSGPTVTGLPAGVTYSYAGDKLTITGTPTVTGNYTYTITTTGCNPQTASGTITVKGQKIALSSGAASPMVCVNTPVNIGFTLSGTATGATTTGLPAGVNGVVSGSGPTYTYTISGAPTVAGSYPYTITTLPATGSCDPVTFSGTITVTAQTITLNPGDNDNQTVCINSPITNIHYNVGGATGAAASGLPPGVTGSYNGGIFTIIGTPSSAAGSPYTYTITTSGPSCAAATITGKITVTPGATLTLTSDPATNLQTVCKGHPIADITYTVNNGTGASAAGLPAGVTGSYAGGMFTITGSPTSPAGTYNYTITASGGCPVAGGTATGTIIVQAQTISLSSGSLSPSVCANTPMPTNIVFLIGGTATGASVSGLPASLTGSYDAISHKFTISGTPTAAPGLYSYTVTTAPATGACDPVTATGTITISPTATGGNLTSISICSGSSTILTLSGQTGTIIRWEYSDDGSTWVQVANTSISLTTPILTAPRMYKVLVGNNCGNVYSSVATVNIHNLWTGVTSTDWNVTSNWSDNQLPSFASCTTVIIPVGTPNAPQLTSSVTIPNLNIASGASLSLNGNTLTINGSFTGSVTGNLKGSATSSLVIGGNATSLFFDPTNNILKTLTLNNNASATLGNALNIATGTYTNSGSITANTGSTLHTDDVSGGGVLTLKSDVNGDARVAESYGAIKGNVVVERYIPPRRAWRFITAPVNSSQTINAAWQEGVFPGNPDIYTHIDPHPGFGTEITYDNNPLEGYDVNTQSNPSIRYWSPAANDFLALPSGTISTNLNAYPGYYLFVRGSRAIDLSQAVTAPPDATVLRANGSLSETGVASNKVTTLSGGMPASSYLFVGNPYASPIKLSDVLHSRITGFKPDMFWVWDPKINGSLGVGAYVAYSDGVWQTVGGSYGAGDPPVIQSGQAFMVKLDDGNTSGSLEFQQVDKYPSEASVFGLKQQQQNPQAVFHTTLMTPLGNDLTLLDGVAAAFGEGNSTGIDKKDASKKWNTTESIGLFRYNKWQAIEFRPIPILTDTLFYALYYLNQKSYTLKITAQDVPAGFPQAWLVDKYLNTKTALDINTPLLYSFTANSDVKSYQDRFMLVFKRTFIATPVPVTKVINQNNPGTTGNANSIAGTVSGVSVHPNPVATGEKVMLQFSNMNKGKYQVTVTNTAGKALSERTIEHDGGSNTYSLQTDARWAAGAYFIKITGENGYSLITKLVISK